MTQVRFLKPAQTEVDEAVAYFDEQRDGLGDRFEQDLAGTIRFLIEYPLTGKQLAPHIRKLRLRTFSYNIIYALDRDEIVIVAVAHHKRRPGYWRSRLTSS